MPVSRWTCLYADLNPVRGSEQAGVRPVLVVSNDESNAVMPNVTVVPLTTAPRSLYPFEARLPKGAAGQPKESIVMGHQIRTISKERLGRILGRLEAPRMRQDIEDAVKEYLDFT